MLSRLTTLGIVAFWLVMSGLLIRPGGPAGQIGHLDVPVSYVIRIMFKNAQQSVLSLREGDIPIGILSCGPPFPPTTGGYSISRAISCCKCPA